MIFLVLGKDVLTNSFFYSFFETKAATRSKISPKNVDSDFIVS